MEGGSDKGITRHLVPAGTRPRRVRRCGPDIWFLQLQGTRRRRVRRCGPDIWFLQHPGTRPRKVRRCGPDIWFLQLQGTRSRKVMASRLPPCIEHELLVLGLCSQQMYCTGADLWWFKCTCIVLEQTCGGLRVLVLYWSRPVVVYVYLYCTGANLWWFKCTCALCNLCSVLTAFPFQNVTWQQRANEEVGVEDGLEQTDPMKGKMFYRRSSVRGLAAILWSFRLGERDLFFNPWCLCCKDSPVHRAKTSAGKDEGEKHGGVGMSFTALWLSPACSGHYTCL